jgi:uncharacterized membrane protein HdeD (DUF308 family)
LYGKLVCVKDELQNYMARPKRYDNIDGTGEIYMGLMLLGFALLGYLQTILPENSMWRNNGFASLLFMYIILGPVLALGYWGVKTVKKHITWPRTGYVAYGMGGLDDKTHKKSIWILMAGVAVFSAVIAAGLACVLALERRHPYATNLAGVVNVGYLAFWVLVYAFWIWRMGKGHPWKWLVLLFMALGLLVIGLMSPGNFIEASRPVTLFVGLTWIISGVATLILYLWRTPPPAPEAE